MQKKTAETHEQSTQTLPETIATLDDDALDQVCGGDMINPHEFYDHMYDGCSCGDGCHCP